MCDPPKVSFLSFHSSLSIPNLGGLQDLAEPDPQHSGVHLRVRYRAVCSSRLGFPRLLWRYWSSGVANRSDLRVGMSRPQFCEPKHLPMQGGPCVEIVCQKP